MRQVAFEVRDGSKKAEITVIALAASAGDLLANVNRWREQVHLGPVAPRRTRAAVEGVPGRRREGSSRGARRPGECPAAGRYPGSHLLASRQGLVLQDEGRRGAGRAGAGAFRVIRAFGEVRWQRWSSRWPLAHCPHRGIWPVRMIRDRELSPTRSKRHFHDDLVASGIAEDHRDGARHGDHPGRGRHAGAGRPGCLAGRRRLLPRTAGVDRSQGLLPALLLPGPFCSQ